MTVREDCAVEEVKQGEIVTVTGKNVEFNECLWCTQAGAPEWLKATGLPLGNICSYFVSGSEQICYDVSDLVDKTCEYFASHCYLSPASRVHPGGPQHFRKP